MPHCLSKPALKPKYQMRCSCRRGKRGREDAGDGDGINRICQHVAELQVPLFYALHAG